jgi:hypothetical protein
MVILAAAVLATASPQQPQPSRSAVTVQATATIRIVSGVVLKLDAASNPGAPPPRDSEIRSADGSSTPAKLIEFQ